MRICFIAAGPIEWGSSRMRAYWVADAMRKQGISASVETFDGLTQSPHWPLTHDVIIWQKVADAKLIDALPDARHVWDVCDPSWWWQPDECRRIADRVHGVVASSQALADDFNEWRDEDMATCIPDRLDLAHFPKQRIHQDVNPVRFIWFGVAVNRIALWGAMANLERLVANGHNIELTIMDDRPDIPLNYTNAFPVYHVRWRLDKENEILASHDIAILPPYPGAWGKVKSDNKEKTAAACGLPVLGRNPYENTDYRVLENLATDWNMRRGDSEFRYDVKSKKETVDQSAAEWEALLS